MTMVRVCSGYWLGQVARRGRDFQINWGTYVSAE